MSKQAMEGKTVLITGANRGVGRYTAEGLARMGANVVMACRSTERSAPVREELRKETGNDHIHLVRLDQASLGSVRESAREVGKRIPHLDVLINNAGTFSMRRQETEDGFELTIATNLLGPFLLTHLLLPLMKERARARVINVGSGAHRFGRLDLNDLHLKNGYNGFKAYARSKLGLQFFTQELASRLEGNGITALCVTPGDVATGIWDIAPKRRVLSWLLRGVTTAFMHTPQEGAQPVIYLATAEEVRGMAGMYFDRHQLKPPSPRAGNRVLQEALWRMCEELTGIAPDRP